MQYGEAQPQRGTSIKLQVCKSVGILQVKVHGKGTKLMWHFSLLKDSEGLTDTFYGCKMSGKLSGFVIDSYLTDSALTAVKIDAKF